MKDPNNPCLFCNSKASGIAHENNLAYASYDTYPVSEQHCLIIPKRYVVDYFELSNEELVACNDLIKIVKQEVLDKDKNGLPIGLSSSILTQSTAGTGKLNLLLKHQPELNGVSVKTGQEAGGSTDIDLTFDVEVK